MTTEKTIKVLIEIPEKWVDFESPLGFLSADIKYLVIQNLRDILVNEYMKKVELPDIKITPEELKDKMLTILAERTLDKNV